MIYITPRLYHLSSAISLPFNSTPFTIIVKIKKPRIIRSFMRILNSIKRYKKQFKALYQSSPLNVLFVHHQSSDQPPVHS